MCGVIGYVGSKQAAPLMLDALEKLEYRGYDSSGIAVCGPAGIQLAKRKGRLSVLRESTHNGEDLRGCTGIGHTRWATHGEPSDVNAHPHLSRSGKVALVHNGIIENYAELREFLVERGYTFISDTDTEIAVQLIDYFYRGDPVHAVRETVNLLVGAFSLSILFADYPDRLIAVRKDSPLVIGVGKDENFIASDIPALLTHTRDIIRLGEYEMAVIDAHNIVVFDRFGEKVNKEIQHVTWDAGAAEKGGYPHFMLKEIMEEPDAIRNTVHPRIHTGKVELEIQNIPEAALKALDRIFIVACGSAYHVGVVGKAYIEKFARVPVTVELASEFRYNDPIVTAHTLTVIISQSGETIDTLLALREAKSRGSHILSIVNVVGSSIANESEDVLYTWAGPEIAVATTKAYSTQLTLLYLLALKLGELRGNVEQAEMDAYIQELEALPAKIDRLLGERELLQRLAAKYFSCRDIFFLGRNLDHALALEGSLKLKEISYIHSEAYAAGELKHGTISLIEPGTLAVALCTYAPLLDKMVSNIREVKARGATVIALCQAGAQDVAAVADHVIEVPAGDWLTMPSLSIVPLQLFAYYMALAKGCDIDKPRNLAKSVTVE
ncbi:MAG: glutamine--fructose-6-phosphate transaminase (isomerizing) [Clostridia bacterium]|nr:glutamine--fructose-6-phosphate transaminase (isomerizing) [Clostridia bacterium]